VDADLDTHATALYVRTDDLLKLYPEQVPYRPQVGIAPQISDAEIITLSVMQALLGHGSQARWLRHRASQAPVPLPARAARPQQAAPEVGRDGELADRDARPRHQRVDR
jgi:hypothetical protein